MALSTREWPALLPLSLLCVSFALAACGGKAHSAPPTSGGDRSETLVVGGLKRSYLLYVPPSYDSARKVPLVIALHGNRGTGKDMEKLTLSKFNELANAKGFIVAYPDGIDKSWNDDRGVTPAAEKKIDDIGFISALIDHLSKTYAVDPNRVYAVGMSNGAMFVNRLGCELSDKLAAIAAVAGTMPEVIAARCNPARAVPAIIIHGTADKFAPFAGGATRKDGSGKVLSAADTAAFWAKKNGCTAQPGERKAAPVDQDGTTVEEVQYGKCRGATDVALYVVRNGGHTWPKGWQYLPKILVGPTTQNMDAAATIWAFFEAHPRQ
jgi:polyhydroxybutyrate depolymerase